MSGIKVYQLIYVVLLDYYALSCPNQVPISVTQCIYYKKDVAESSRMGVGFIVICR